MSALTHALVAYVLVSACAGQSTTRGREAADSARPPPPVVTEPRGAALEKLRRSIFKQEGMLLNPLNWFVVQEQALTPGFVGIPAEATLPFPGQPVHHARIFAIAQHGPSYGITCENIAIQPDGTVCPNVVYPGVNLSKEQRDTILTLIRTANPYSFIGTRHRTRRPKLRCGFEPTHAFVFYDAAGLPVGEVGVELMRDVGGHRGGCGSWHFRPRTVVSETVMSKDEQATLFALCEKLRVPGCSQNVDIVEDFYASFRQHSQSEAQRIGIPPQLDSKPLNTTTLAERKWLCAWYLYTYTGFMVPSIGFAARAYACQVPPYKMETFRFPDCIKHFPSCTTPIGQVRACLEAERNDACWEHEATRRACEPVAGCTWGLQHRKITKLDGER